MSRHLHWILDDNRNPIPVDAMTAATWRIGDPRIPDREPWRVAVTRAIPKPHGAWRVEISTVFLHIDHAYDDGPPILFETMIFAPDDPEIDQWTDRYATWAEAEAGHQAAVAMVKRHLGIAPDVLEAGE